MPLAVRPQLQKILEDRAYGQITTPLINQIPTFREPTRNVILDLIRNNSIIPKPPASLNKQVTELKNIYKDLEKFQNNRNYHQLMALVTVAVMCTVVAGIIVGSLAIEGTIGIALAAILSIFALGIFGVIDYCVTVNREENFKSDREHSNSLDNPAYFSFPFYNVVGPFLVEGRAIRHLEVQKRRILANIPEFENYFRISGPILQGALENPKTRARADALAELKLIINAVGKKSN